MKNTEGDGCKSRIRGVYNTGTYIVTIVKFHSTNECGQKTAN